MATRDESDAALVEEARVGIEEAAEALYVRHVRTVRFVVADNVRDLHEIDDVVQEVFARAFSRIDALSDPQCFRSWLLQIARRAAIDARRARCRRPVFASIDECVVIAGDPAPELVAEVRELAVSLSEGVRGLGSRDRAVLSMVVELGFSLDDVAAALDLTYGTAKVVLHRARRRLREAIAHDLDERTLAAVG